MLFTVNPVHASAITAFIVHEDEAFGTSLTDVSKNVVLTAQNVDVAVTLIKMVEVSALKTSGFVFGWFLAGHKAGL